MSAESKQRKGELMPRKSEWASDPREWSHWVDSKVVRWVEPDERLNIDDVYEWIPDRRREVAAAGGWQSSFPNILGFFRFATAPLPTGERVPVGEELFETIDPITGELLIAPLGPVTYAKVSAEVMTRIDAACELDDEFKGPANIPDGDPDDHVWLITAEPSGP